MVLQIDKYAIFSIFSNYRLENAHDYHQTKQEALDKVGIGEKDDECERVCVRESVCKRERERIGIKSFAKI